MHESTTFNDTEEQESGIVLEGWKLYSIIALFVVLLSYVSYSNVHNKTLADEQATKNKILQTSTGAKIEKLMNRIADNKKQWSELEKKQEALNASTEQAEQSLNNLGLSVNN